MVDPLSAALATGQFVGLAGQLVEAVVALRRKLANVKNAPNLIRRIRQELRVLQDCASQLARVEDLVPEDGKVTFLRIFEELKGHITQVSKIMRKIELQDGDQGAKRFWNSFLADGHRPKLEEGLYNIKRANTTLGTFLSAVNTRIISATHDHLVAHSAAMSPSIRRIETNLSATAKTSENILTQTVEVRKDIAQSADTIITRVDHAVQSVQHNIPKLVETGFHQYLQEHQVELIVLAGRDARSVGGPIHHKCNKKSARSVARKRIVTKKFSLGVIQTKAVWADVEEDAGLLNIEIRLTPFRWLSSQGQIMRMDKTITDIYATSWDLSLRSYNIVRNDAMILKACRDLDIVAIEKLFQYGEASAYDVDCDGRGLLSHVWDGVSIWCHGNGPEKIRQVIQFLIARGVDPTSYVREFLKLHRTWAGRYWYEHLCFGESAALDPEIVAAVGSLDECLRLCVENSQTDPFENDETLIALWEASLGGHSMPALGSSHLLREDFLGLEELAFENPDRIFYDIIAQRNGIIATKVFRHDLDLDYDTLLYLCKGGPQSIKGRIFSKDIKRHAPFLGDGKTCFCPTNSSHLLFQHFHEWIYQWGSNWDISRLDKLERARLIRKHVHRVAIELLSSGEDPEARCDCKTTWQWPEGFRTVTDIAGEEGLISEWEAALEHCGYNSTRIIDEWRYMGVPELFGGQEPAPPNLPGETPHNSKSSLAVVGSLIYQTLSTIV